MLKISEFSALSAISIPMLRHYDKIGLLIPSMTDKSNGYRYYQKGQLLQANRIMVLKAMGFGLEDIRTALNTPGRITSMLQDKLLSKSRELEALQAQIRQLNSVLELEADSKNYALSIICKSLPAFSAVSYRGKIRAYSEEGLLWKHLDTVCQKTGIQISTDIPASSVCHGTDGRTGLIDTEVIFPVESPNLPQLESGSENGLLFHQIPSQSIAAVTIQGSYSQIGAVNTAVAQWLESNRLVISGQPFTIYHASPADCSNSQCFITELCFPVQKK